jgi:hypothetical protein
VFHEREEAAQWLGVPIERLEMSSNPQKHETKNNQKGAGMNRS